MKLWLLPGEGKVPVVKVARADSFFERLVRARDNLIYLKQLRKRDYEVSLNM